MCFSSYFWPSWLFWNTVFGDFFNDHLPFIMRHRRGSRDQRWPPKLDSVLKLTHQDPQSATKQLLILTAMHGFLGSLPVMLASTSNARSVFWAQHRVFTRLKRCFLSLYKVDAVHKKEKSKRVDPHHRTKTVQEIKGWKKQMKIKIAIAISFHKSWTYISTCHTE